jgi:DNA polymerase-3 subunit delta
MPLILPSPSKKPIHLVDVCRACEKLIVPRTKPKTAVGSIHAVVGSDEAELKRVAAELARKFAPAAAGDFGLEIIDGAVDNAEQAAARVRSTIEALQTLPFMGDGKVVWLKNANFLGDTPAGRSASVLTALEELSELISGGIGADVTFLLSATDVDKRRMFYKSLAKHAELQVFDRVDSTRVGWEEEALETVRTHAKKRKLQFDDDALDLFVLLTGGDTRQIDNELEKIDIYLGRGTGFQPVGKAGVSPPKAAAKMAASPTAETAVPRIDVDVVRELVPLARGGVVFELGNALAERDVERALRLVRRLLDQGETAIGILLVAILPTVRNLLFAKDLMERHRLPRPHVPFQFISALNRLPAEATAHLPRKKDGSINAYALGIAAQNAHHFNTEQLINGLNACLDANLKLVTTQLEHELVLTELVVKLLGL